MRTMLKTKKQANLRCGVCGEKNAYPITISKVFGRGENAILIEDIPAFNCLHCHQQYIEAETMDAIDKIRRNPGAFTHKRPIDVAQLIAA